MRRASWLRRAASICRDPALLISSRVLALCVHRKSSRPLGCSSSMNRRLDTMKSSSGAEMPDFSCSYQIFPGYNEYVQGEGIPQSNFWPKRINFLLWGSRVISLTSHPPPWGRFRRERVKDPRCALAKDPENKASVRASCTRAHARRPLRGPLARNFHP
jgi:hypothetical protein